MTVSAGVEEQKSKVDFAREWGLCPSCDDLFKLEDKGECGKESCEPKRATYDEVLQSYVDPSLHQRLHDILEKHVVGTKDFFRALVDFQVEIGIPAKFYLDLMVFLRKVPFEDKVSTRRKATKLPSREGYPVERIPTKKPRTGGGGGRKLPKDLADEAAYRRALDGTSKHIWSAVLRTIADKGPVDIKLASDTLGVSRKKLVGQFKNYSKEWLHLEVSEDELSVEARLLKPVRSMDEIVEEAGRRS